MEGEGVDLPRSYTAWREGQERGKERMIRAQQLVLLREALRTCHFHAGVNYKEECAKLALAYIDAWSAYRSVPWNSMMRSGKKVDEGQGHSIVVRPDN